MSQSSEKWWWQSKYASISYKIMILNEIFNNNNIFYDFLILICNIPELKSKKVTFDQVKASINAMTNQA